MATGRVPGGHTRYPGYDVLGQAPTWDRRTTGVVLRRLGPPPPTRFFTPGEEAVARPLLDRLLAQDDEPRVPVFEHVDSRLAELPVAGQWWPWGDPHRYPHTAHPVSGLGDIFLRGCQRLGIQARVGPVAIANGRFGNRAHCIYRGFCLQGCKVNAKASPLITHVPDALAHGAEIRANSMVSRIEIDPDGLATGVVYVKDGVERRQVRSYKAPPPEVSTEAFYETDPTKPYKRGFSIQTVGPLPITWAEHVAAGGHWGQVLREYMRDYVHWAVLGALAELLPLPDNRVTLSGETDRYGLPVAHFSYSQCDNDRELIKAGTQVMEEILRAAGAQETVTIDRYAHLVGGCRMAADERSGVVDANLRSFAVPNLYIADGSVLPTQGSANPALTIMALAARLGDHLGRR